MARVSTSHSLLAFRSWERGKENKSGLCRWLFPPLTWQSFCFKIKWCPSVLLAFQFLGLLLREKVSVPRFQRLWNCFSEPSSSFLPAPAKQAKKLMHFSSWLAVHYFLSQNCLARMLKQAENMRLFFLLVWKLVFFPTSTFNTCSTASGFSTSIVSKFARGQISMLQSGKNAGKHRVW